MILPLRHDNHAEDADFGVDSHGNEAGVGDGADSSTGCDGLGMQLLPSPTPMPTTTTTTTMTLPTRS